MTPSVQTHPNTLFSFNIWPAGQGILKKTKYDTKVRRNQITNIPNTGHRRVSSRNGPLGEHRHQPPKGAHSKGKIFHGFRGISHLSKDPNPKIRMMGAVDHHIGPYREKLRARPNLLEVPNPMAFDERFHRLFQRIRDIREIKRFEATPISESEIALRLNTDDVAGDKTEQMERVYALLRQAGCEYSALNIIASNGAFLEIKIKKS